MKPVIAVMHDYENRDWATERPSWGPVGAWQYWGWSALYPNPEAVIEPYLAKAATQGKPVSISVMLYEDIGRDSTPTTVYAQLGRAAGWTLTAADGRTTTCPLYGDAGWEAMYAALIQKVGARYNGDPRIHSIWIATGIYGETIIAKDGFTLPAYYFRRWVVRAMDQYIAAFSDTPLFILLSTTDRAYYVSEAIKRGIGVKQNTLLPDPPNAYLVGGNGQAEASLAALSAGAATGFEHAYNPRTDTYGAMLYALAMGATVIDLPPDYLDALAALRHPTGDPLWSWMLRWMRRDYGAFWIARDTANTRTSGSWSWGYSGPYARRIQHAGGNVALFARNDTLPSELQTYVSAYGAGYIAETATFRHELTGRVRVSAVASKGVIMEYAGRTVSSVGDGWQLLRIDANANGDISLTGPGYLHGIWIEPLSSEEENTTEGGGETQPQPDDGTTEGGGETQPPLTLEQRVAAIEARLAKLKEALQ